MKIGIDIRLIGKNQTGSEVYFFNLVKNLSQIDKRNEYFLFTDRNPMDDPELEIEVEKMNLGENFKVVTLRCPNRFWWNIWSLPAYLRKNPLDVFHTQYIAPFWFPKKVKLILTIHDISFNFYPQFIRKSDLFFLRILIPGSIRKAAKVITVSGNERKQIMDFYKIAAERVNFIHNGVDFDRFAREFSDKEKTAIRAKYGLPKKFLLYVGTLQPRKNIPALLRALAAFYEKYPDGETKLVIVGNRKAHNFDGRIDEEIKNGSLGARVVFPGWIEDEDLPAIYKLAECFVFPSLYEGFGIPIVEAMAAGAPVISSDKSSLPEVGGNGAIFVDPGNPTAFAAKIHEILSDANLRSSMMERGLETAKSYSWQKTAEKTLGLYENLYFS